jgi:aspartyl-tRNA(Asn)/glutamyl-tRNA(Gln) amidotransferase subunit C
VSLTLADVELIATLARMNLTEEEKNLFLGQLGAVIDHIEKLNELNTDRESPAFEVLPMRNVFREDEPRQPFPEGKTLANAPEQDKDHFRVPKIIE